MKGIIITETDSPASPTGPDSGNPNAPDVDSNAPAPVLPPKPGMNIDAVHDYYIDILLFVNSVCLVIFQ